MAPSDSGRNDTADGPSEHQMLRNRRTETIDTQKVEVGSPRLSHYDDSEPSQPPSPYLQHNALPGIGDHFEDSVSSVPQHVSNRYGLASGTRRGARRGDFSPRGRPKASMQRNHPPPLRSLKRVGTDSYQKDCHREQAAPHTSGLAQQVERHDDTGRAEQDATRFEAHHDSISHKEPNSPVQSEAEANEGEV